MDTESLKRSLLQKFQEVSADRLQKIQLGVLDLEKPTADQAADEVARELHTMKGEARMLGLAAIGQLAHAAEDVLRAEREGKAATEVVTDLLLRACDTIADLLEDAEGAQVGTPASEEMCEALSAASGHPIPPIGGVKAASSTRLPAAPPPESVLEVMADAVEPAYAPAYAPPPPPSPPVPAAPRAAKAEHEEPHHKLADRSIRVNVEVLDSLGLLAGDLLVESARGRLRASQVEALLQRFSRLGDRFLRITEQLEVPNSLRNDVERIEGDLHMLRDDAFRFVRSNGDGIETLHGNLAMMADHVAEARLVPLSTVFDAFPRAVRDLSRAQAKEVELVIENADLGVDRSMLADVRDALVHLLRNGVDHGLESPDERRMLGKPAAGRLRIRVRADGDMLSIEVDDDGRGMDPQKLREVAVRKHLLTENQAASLSEREAIELIFRPGFSTRDEVTDISGRGVGMDVVKKKVESLGGSVGISSRLGRGSTFTLRLPQSLALMKVLLVRLGDDVYGIPAADVVAVMRVKPDDRMEVFGTLAVKHRGKPIALVGLGPLLGVNGGNRFDKPPAVVVRHGDDHAALVVDGFVDEREVA
ncbi:MAG: ATP-binding protein, partial [Cystobacter sp.]